MIKFKDDEEAVLIAKEARFGRENAIEAIRQCLQLKRVWINTGGAVPNSYAGDRSAGRGVC